MNRAKLNLLVDTIALFGFLFLASTGVLLKLQLPPGSGRIAGEGAGWREASRPVSLVWGLTRHEWGEVHFWTAIAIAAVLSLHLFLHWRWIYGVLHGKKGAASGLRLAIGACALALLVIAAALPLVADKTTRARSELRGDAKEKSQQEERTPADTIYGAMSLRQASEATSVPLSYICEQLHLSADTSPGERLGRLGREHNFTVEDVRSVIARYRSNNTPPP